MIGMITERKLALLLKQYADHEDKIEEKRIEIAKIFCFEPRTAFRRIDRGKNYCLSAEDIQLFLEENQVYVTLQEAGSLVVAYDADKDGCLDFKEFERLVLPATSTLLKVRAYGREQRDLFKHERLYYEIEQQLTKLLLMEINGLKEINIERKIVKARHDFSRLGSFDLIDTYQLNCLLREDLRIFMAKSGVEVTQLDAENLMRRIDMDQDGVITYQEYCAFLEQSFSHKTDQYENTVVGRLETPMGFKFDTQVYQQNENEVTFSNHNTHNDEDQILPINQAYLKEEDEDGVVYTKEGLSRWNASPLRKSQSPQKQKSPFSNSLSQTRTNFSSANNNQLVMSSPPRPYSSQSNLNISLRPRYLNLQEQTDVVNEAIFKLDRPHNNNSPMQGNQEEKLVDAIKELIRIELQLEKDKQQLAVKHDFNLFQAFRLLDKRGVGYLTIKDFVEGLAGMGVVEPRSHIFLVFQKFDVKNECKIKFSDFSNMMAPIDRNYAQMLNLKQPNYVSFVNNQNLSKSTISQFAYVLRSHVQSEIQAESVRQGLTENPQFSISEAFQTIDSNKKGYVTRNEFSILLEAHQFVATEKELDLVFDRFDNDKDGRVTYGEFFSEISPKRVIIY